MAKKLTKAQIAKNPTKAINSGQMKMRKQEVPFGGIGKAAAKVVGKVIGKKTAASKGATGAKLSPYSGGIKAKVSDNVTVRIKAKPNYEFSKDLSTVNKIAKQNAASSGSAKANARGLKAANKPTKAGKVMKKTTSTKKMEDVPAGVSSRFNATLEGLAKQSTSKPAVTAGKKDMSAFINKRAVRNEQMFSQSKPGFSQGKTKLLRQIKASNKKSK
jgi:hypothetical protein